MISLSFDRILRNSRSFWGSRSLTKLLAMPAKSGMSSAYFSVCSAWTFRKRDGVGETKAVSVANY